MKTNKSVIHPCQGCIYFKAYGNTARTEPCAGRMTKREAKNALTNVRSVDQGSPSK